MASAFYAAGMHRRDQGYGMRAQRPFETAGQGQREEAGDPEAEEEADG